MDESLGHNAASEHLCEQRDLFEGHPKSGGDLMLVAKRWMADPAPAFVQCVLLESVCLRIESTMSRRPEGVCARRPITEQVGKIFPRTRHVAQN